MTRPIATEVAIKVRVSTGFSVVDYIGSFMRQQGQDVPLSAIDADKTVAVLIRNDER